jgi:hypothetical protein
MRSPLPLLLALSVAMFVGQFARAEEVMVVDPRISARHALECAKLDYQLYTQVDFPREVRHLESSVKFTKAEVDMLDRRVREFNRFNRFEIGRPLHVSFENAKLALLDAQLRLKDLEAELFALRRFHGDRCRMLELKVYQARVHLVHLEGGPAMIAPAVAEEPLDSV